MSPFTRAVLRALTVIVGAVAALVVLWLLLPHGVPVPRFSGPVNAPYRTVPMETVLH